MATRAVRSGEEWAVTGTTMFVVDGHTADLILVAAVAEDGLGLFAVEG